MVMVYSSSIATAEASKFTGGSPAYFLQRQRAVSRREPVRGACSPFRCPCVCGSRPRRGFSCSVSRCSPCCSLRGLGREVNGARRWLSLGLVNLQPSEFMKLFVVLYAAD